MSAPALRAAHLLACAQLGSPLCMTVSLVWSFASSAGLAEHECFLWLVCERMHVAGEL